jgi:hypothetical protein
MALSSVLLAIFIPCSDSLAMCWPGAASFVGLLSGLIIAKLK